MMGTNSFQELLSCLEAYRAARMKFFWRVEKPDINKLALKVATEISDTNKIVFGETLFGIIAHKDQLRPEIRQYLVECLDDQQKQHRKLANREQKKAERIAELINKLAMPKDALQTLNGGDRRGLAQTEQTIG
jgi:cell division FtsZ-interacting protein ZapD